MIDHTRRIRRHVPVSWGAGLKHAEYQRIDRNHRTRILGCRLGSRGASWEIAGCQMTDRTRRIRILERELWRECVSSDISLKRICLWREFSEEKISLKIYLWRENSSKDKSLKRKCLWRENVSEEKYGCLRQRHLRAVELNDQPHSSHSKKWAKELRCCSAYWSMKDLLRCYSLS